MKNFSMNNTEEINETRIINPKLNEIVLKILKLHEGGRNFFDNLDAAVKDPDIVSSLYHMIHKTTGVRYCIQISTGGFGRFYSNWIRSNGSDLDDVYLVNGGLREGNPIDSLEPFKSDINGQDFIIIDDSFYSGKTVDKIIEHVKSLGGNYVGTFVVYDGSHNKREDINSLYRYYEI